MANYYLPPIKLNSLIGYYGVTFDHLVPDDDPNPDVLQINISEIEDDHGVYANTWLLFAVDPVEFIGKKVLEVPRCCQKKKGRGIAGVLMHSWIRGFMGGKD